jgi:hypothetical protein
MFHERRPVQRLAATSVEFAVVALVLFVLLFGIFEYARFLFVHHVTTNAARDAARFAAVKTGGGTMPGEPALVTVEDVKEVARSGVFNGQPYGAGMCGVDSQLSGFAVAVYAVPDADLYASPPNLNPAGKPPWSSAAFHEKIAVQVTGTYKPVLYGLIGFDGDIPVAVTVLLSSEGN